MPQELIPDFCLQCYTHKSVITEKNICSTCQYYNENPDKIRELLGSGREGIGEVKGVIAQLLEELTTERETTQQALQTSQEWHQRQKGEIIAEWKQKLANLIQQRKNQIRQELTLIRDLLSHE